MSAWASFDGYIVVRRDAHISIESVLEEIFDDYRKPVISKSEKQLNTYFYEIYFEFCEEADDAVVKFKQFIKVIKELDRTVEMDLNLHTRWLS
jgi:hypothetical protein